jgi:hypothetical protein
MPPRPLLLVGSLLLAALAAPRASFALTGIGNGDGPPNPLNVIDGDDPPGEDYVVCPVYFPSTGCFVVPGEMTSVEIRSGADVGDLEALTNSAVSVLGGTTSQITARGASTVLLDLQNDPLTLLDVGGVVAHDDVSVTVEDGKIGGVLAYENVSVTIADGYLGEVRAHDDVSVEVAGGTISYLLLAGNATLTQTGAVDGLFEVTEQSSMLLAGDAQASGLDSGVVMSGSGFLEMVGGHITDNGLQASGDARIQMSGGRIDTLGVLLSEQASMLWSGGEISELELLDTSQLSIAGDSFEIDGIPVDLGLVGASSGLLSGILASGDPFAVPFTRASGARLFLLPEPSTGSLVGLGLVALAARRARAPRGAGRVRTRARC